MESNMNFAQRLTQDLENSGMFPNQAQEVMDLFLAGEADSAMASRWHHDTSEYPEGMYNVLWATLKCYALKYIDEKCPQARFRPMFLSKDEQDKLFAEPAAKPETTFNPDKPFWVDPATQLPVGKSTVRILNEPVKFHYTNCTINGMKEVRTLRVTPSLMQKIQALHKLRRKRTKTVPAYPQRKKRVRHKYKTKSTQQRKNTVDYKFITNKRSVKYEQR